MKLLLIALSFSFISFLGLSQNQGWEQKMLESNANFFDIQEQFEAEWKNKSYQKGKGWKQFKRWENFWETRIMEDGSFPMNHKTIWASFKNKLLSSNAKSGGIGDWTPLGPFDFQNTDSWSAGSGRVNCIVEDPNDANTIYLGSPAGGAWKSVDAGSSWAPLSDELSVIGISSIAVDATNSNIIYLATGDTDGGDTYSIGLMKSIDAGTSWNEVGSISSETNEILIDPSNSNTLWLATDNGLMKSVNGGTAWTTSLAGNIRDIAIKPGTANTIYAATSTAVYYTTDGGNNWNTSTGIPNGIGRIAITVTPANNNYVYLLISKNDWTYQGVYRSANSGSSFTARNTTTDVFESEQAWYDMAISVSDTDPETIITGVLNIWRSTNGGSSLTKLNSWSAPNSSNYTHADIHFLRYYDGSLYCGSDGGIYKSTNNGTTFTDLSPGLQIGQFYRLGSSPNDVNALSGGLQDNGGYAYVNGVWKNWYGADGMEAGIDPNNSNIRFGMIQNGDLYRTVNGANSSQSLGQPEQGRWVTPLQMDLNNDRLLAGYNDLHEYNYTTGWNQLSTFTFPALLRSIEVYDGNSNIIFVATDDNIYRTIDNGTNFTDITNNLPTNSIITSIEVNPTNSNEIWVTRGGWSVSNHIFHTTNGGLNWNNITSNIPNLPCNIVKYDPSGTGGLYVGTDIGVYFLDLTSTSWVQYMNNLPNVIVNDLEINVTSKVIRAGTYGRGVWESGVYSRNNEDAGISAIITPNDTYCNIDSFNPVVTLTNYAINELNSITINYDIDGLGTLTYSWTGSLLTGESEDITLPTVTSTNGSHIFNAYTTLPNGFADEEINNDASDKSFLITLNGNPINFLLNTDCWGSEVTWIINDDLGVTVFSNPQYSDETNGGNYNQEVCLQEGCYDFIISDGYGDGMYGSQYGSCSIDGYYNFTNSDGDTLAELIAVNSDYGFSETNNFCITSSVNSSFTATNTVICQGSTVDFSDLSTGTINQWDWTFTGGTPSSSNIQNPTNIQYDTPGTYAVELTVGDGTSTNTSMINAYITVNSTSSQTDNISTCISYFWPTNGQTYNTSGQYSATFQNVNQCDSIVTLNLTILEATNSLTTITECGSYDWNGTNYSSSGNYTYSTTNSVGCDSIATLDLTIINSPIISLGSFTNPSACAATDGSILINGSGTGVISWTGALSGNSGMISLPYLITGLSTGSYSITFIDNCVSNNLTQSLVDPGGTTSSTSLTECDSYTWNGTTYNTSGTYTFNTLNSAGCDSTATLNLFINNSTVSSINITECVSYLWNGTTYNTTGTYTFNGINSVGCDSTATLNLTINQPSTSLEIVSECETYIWNGTTYNSSGIYVANLTNIAGCDSTATLDLTILEPTNSLTTITECESYNWNGTDYNSTGIYATNLVNAIGCDSTATLDLTILEATNSTTTITECESYNWNGTNYNSTGIYVSNFTNSVGCDSTATLDLAITSVDVSTSQPSDISIQANASGLVYQWLNCNDNYSFLNGENNQILEANVNGSYAVQITNNNCIDTSACTIISNVGIESNDFGTNLEVFPNPTSGNLKINLGNNFEMVTTRLYSVNGKLIFSNQYMNTDSIDIQIEESVGYYFIEVETSDNKFARIKVLKE